MGVHELCNRCHYLTTAKWSLVDDDAPVDEELRDGKSFWIVEDEDAETKKKQNGKHSADNGIDVAGNASDGGDEASSVTTAHEDQPAEAFAPFSHHSLGDIVTDPELNCHLCRCICENLQQLTEKERYAGEDGDHLFAIPFLINESIIDPLTKTLAFYYFWEDGRSPDSVFAVYLYLKPIKDTTVAPYVDISRSSRPQTMEAIGDWLQECSSGHDRCNELGARLAGELPTPGLPARLLELSKQNERPFVRLCSSSTLHPETKYATLSHCWGSYGRFKLNSANQHDLHHRIPFAALPQVFADAIRVALDLGVSYLWIDALCIIQDSEEDWIAESASMAWVYSQSYVNIAATAGTEGKDSLFCQKDQLLANSLVLDTEFRGSHLGSKVWLCFDEARWHTYVAKAPLNQRAWVLQERLLSPRTVHFAKDQIWWSCRTSQRCESLPTSLSAGQLHGDLFEQLSRGNWESIVETYTASQLTYSRDRLVALSGLAWAYQVMHRIPAGQYIAGLWATNLQMQLLWKTKGRSQVAKKHRAPSWSWAAIDGAVEWDVSSVSSKKIWFAWGMRSWFDDGADPYGPAVRASLRVDCMIYPVTVTKLGTRYAHSDSRAATSSSSPYAVRSDSERFGAKKAAWGGLARVSPDDDGYFDGDAVATYFLPICIVDANHRNHGQYPIISGLLIKPVPDERGTYRRVGKLDMTYYKSPNVWTLYREWMAGETLKPLLYQKDHGGCRYDILLV